MNIQRRGFTLIELLIALVVTALVSLAMLNTVRGTLLFGERSERGRAARSIARSSLSLAETDLQSVVATATGTTPVEAATATSVTVKIPVALGVLCNTTGTTATISLLPTDSLAFAAGNIAGAAYRSTSGDWVYSPGAFVPGAGASSVCLAANVTTLASGIGASAAPAGKVLTIAAAIPVTTSAGTLVMLYRRVQYAFATSVQLPGTTALWRYTLGATGTSPAVSLELAAPFSSAAAFGFYTGTSRVPSTSVPTDLRTIRGLELVLPGQSETGGRNGAAQTVETVRTSVFFRNRTE